MIMKYENWLFPKTAFRCIFIVQIFYYRYLDEPTQVHVLQERRKTILSEKLAKRERIVKPQYIFIAVLAVCVGMAAVLPQVGQTAPVMAAAAPPAVEPTAAPSTAQDGDMGSAEPAA